ncbi:hypothetical protein K431DRAFT_306736 [Polychaeton citri CBS 116435]|uniref:Hydrophobin n=1 Tax=Polychaeton citri CBS 116435 TaxID=1314669 RepID=A0A9P4ULB3_9PEZI|nr:hypothetical protein K431DRAFT_306736 [Polychaeton citri CBS 116435]
MHFNKYLTLAALMATTSLAAPAAEAEAAAAQKPTKPAKPTATPVSQANQCANGAQPYCCNTDNKGLYTDCYVMGTAGICSSTTVCCNANNSIQICLGNAVINSPPL